MLSFSPALNTTTRLAVGAAQEIEFSCLCESKLSGKTPEVWTSLPSGEWHAVPLVLEENVAGDDQAQSWRAKIQQSASEESSYEFTYRLRSDDGGIEWLGADGSNGAVIINKKLATFPTELNYIWRDLPTEIEVTTLSATNSTQIRSFSYILPENTAKGGIASIPLGQPMLAPPTPILLLERDRTWWQSTRLCNSITEVSPNHETQLIVGKCGDSSLVYAIFPLATNNCLATLAGSLTPNDQNTPLWLRCEKEASAGSSNTKASCIFGWAKEEDVHELMADVTKAAKSIIGSQPKGKSIKVDLERTKAGHGLRYCTWNSLGRDYTLSRVCEALDSFKQSRCDEFLDSVLFDDGWQDVTQDFPEDQRRLQSFGAREGWLDVELDEKEATVLHSRADDSGYSSPRISQNGAAEADEHGLNNLASAIQVIRSRYPFIKRVGCWITMQGYWRGMSPELIESCGGTPLQFTVALPNQAHSILHFPAVQDLPTVYKHYFESLRKAGVDFIKMDNQAMMDFVIAGEDYVKLKKEAYRHAHSIARDVFGAENVIHCMAHSPRMIGGDFALDTSAPKHFRQYDDFIPDNENSRRLNHVHNARWSLLTAPTALVPDFDMFQSKHAFAEFHATLHCFTSLPVDITDPVGQHDAELLSKLGGRRPNGKWENIHVEEKAIVPAKSVFAPLLESELGQAQQAMTFTAQCVGGKSALAGLWNCSNTVIAQSVNFRNVFGGIAPESSSTDYAVYSHQSAKVFTNQEKTFILQSKQVELLTMAPFYDIETTRVACIGLTDKFGGVAALDFVKIAPSLSQSEETPAGTVLDEPIEGKQVTVAKSEVELPLFARFFRHLFSTITSFGRALFYLLGFGWSQKETQRQTERTPLLQQDSVAPAVSRKLQIPQTRPSALHVGLRHAGNLSFLVTPAAGQVRISVDQVELQEGQLQFSKPGADLKMITVPVECFPTDSNTTASAWNVQLSVV